jgi:hypothetical protein
MVGCGPDVFHFGPVLEAPEGEEDGPLTFDPCYTLSVMHTDKGPAIAATAYGYGLFTKRVPVVIEQYDTIVDLGEADPQDLQKFVKFVEAAEAQKRAMRAQQAGIALVHGK